MPSSRTPSRPTYSSRPADWIEYGDAVAAENERLREALVTLADNTEAYLDLELDGAKNYPDSLRLCVDGAREALAPNSKAGNTN